MLHLCSAIQRLEVYSSLILIFSYAQLHFTLHISWIHIRHPSKLGQHASVPKVGHTDKMAEVTMDDCSGKIMQRSIIQSVQYDIFFGTG